MAAEWQQFYPVASTLDRTISAGQIRPFEASTDAVTPEFTVCAVDCLAGPSHITSMALSKKKATTIALDPEADHLLTRAARERRVSRSEFIRQQLALVLEQ